MNKEELVKKVADKVDGLTATSAAKVIDATTEAIMEALKEGETVRLIGFGTFEAKQRAERQVRNPQTGEAMTVPAMVRPVFKAGKLLKELLN